MGCGDPFIVEDAVTTVTRAAPKSLPGSPAVQVTDITSRSVTLQWSPPGNTGGVELTAYILEKRSFESAQEKWTKVCCI